MPRNNLARTYEDGRGVPGATMPRPRVSFRRAADQGVAAQSSSTQVAPRRIGRGVPKDYKEAAKWYAQGGRPGRCHKAQFNLGVMYYYGRGVTTRTPVEAVTSGSGPLRVPLPLPQWRRTLSALLHQLPELIAACG